MERENRDEIVCAIRDGIRAKAEDRHRDFTKKLVRSGLPIFGVRLPVLRATAKELSTRQGRALTESRAESVEEQLLLGFWIGVEKLDAIERIRLLESLMTAADNWSVCDSTATAQKDMRKNPDAYRSALDRWSADGRREYVARFGIVCTLSHCLTDAEIESALSRLAGAAQDFESVKKARAWAYTTTLAKYPDRTLEELARVPLDQKTIRWIRSKSRESYRVPSETFSRLETVLSAREKQSF